MAKVPSQLSPSAKRIMEYLEIVNSVQEKLGYAKRFDFYKKALAGGYTDTVISKLVTFALIREEVVNLGEKEEKRYYLTKRGEDYLKVYRLFPDVAILYNFFSGDKLR
jgi:hypothetical protein